MINDRMARARRGRNNLAKANMGDPETWQELTEEKKRKAAEEEARRKAELEKSKIVVDVYRGDKHVQESFR
jgi:hypothetical protein